MVSEILRYAQNDSAQDLKKLPLLKVQEEVYIYTVLSSSRYE